MTDFSDPDQVYDLMLATLNGQRRERILVAERIRGWKAAAIQVRKATYEAGLLGRHYRELTILDGKIAMETLESSRLKLVKSLKEVNSRFLATWATRGTLS